MDVDIYVLSVWLKLSLSNEIKSAKRKAQTTQLLDRVMFIDVFRKPPQETAEET